VLSSYDFIAHNFTDDNAITNTDKKLKAMIKNLGQISIEIHRVTISEQLDPTHHAAPKSNIDTVPEKALKGRSLSRKTEYASFS
jgi:hypothetical protein